MSYLVLARKWRPRRFAELVGQEHVVRALSNALASGRVHHAFLFTGTRGVGKTTIARIFAKSLNCEQGVSAEPCGVCPVCEAVDSGRFVDLLEIDAASNTGVDDVRDLIENAQYMPTRGRYKVYLIDEVHMLSKSAFNALLKTLEEPPEHVKFLLATTDPQKLPVTVLSRCLQFNLKRLDEEQIEGQMQRILGAEGIDFEAGALRLLARGADGSLRDGLSLLDQAIAYAGGRVPEAEVRAMLGTVDGAQVLGLLQALAAADGQALLARIEEAVSFSPDFGAVLDELAALLHRVQLRQLVPGHAVEPEIEALAEAIAPELVQLWYQMAITGRRDLSLAPSARVGFEMALLRMLAFRPVESGSEAAAPPAAPAAGSAPQRSGPRQAPPLPPALASASAPASGGRALAAAQAVTPSPPPSARPLARLADAQSWLALLEGLPLRGPVRQLAANVVHGGLNGDELRLLLPPALEHLASDLLLGQLRETVSEAVGVPLRLRIERTEARGETLLERERRAADARQQEAEAAFLAHPAVRQLMQEQGATLVPGSIKPLN
jgi:DNA polymerase III subunit gamma/tau